MLVIVCVSRFLLRLYGVSRMFFVSVRLWMLGLMMFMWILGFFKKLLGVVG